MPTQTPPWSWFPAVQRGFTLLELLITLAIAAVLIAGLAGVTSAALDALTDTRERNDLTRQARFALERMTRAVSRTRNLLLPLAENPATGHSESIRDPGVLAVTLDPELDRDGDGFPDADNDKDGLIDEDWPSDMNDDGEDGLIGLDDDNAGDVDEDAPGDSFSKRDDDEDGTYDEDPVDGVDNDGDGQVDEDAFSDMNSDGVPGLSGVDDDEDGLVDEGHLEDDDEDGVTNEDWLDAVAYRLAGSQLLERHPNLNPGNGADFTERVIAENVTTFQVERIAQGSGRAVLVDITLGLQTTRNEVLFNTQVRVAGGL